MWWVNGMKKYTKVDQRVLAVWALDCAERVLPFFERRNANDCRPKAALDVGREWVRTGVFSMSAIREASLAAHAAAKELKFDVPACEAAHAAGQAVATAHVPQHAYGGAYYSLRAIIAENPDGAEEFVRKELSWQGAQLPKNLRDEIMPRLIVKTRGNRLIVSINKGPGF
tara:strand:+ start:2983 stop:3492 length:510 start_codon:yes stop_codon:yes gene_type:complete